MSKAGRDKLTMTDSGWSAVPVAIVEIVSKTRDVCWGHKKPVRPHNDSAWQDNAGLVVAGEDAPEREGDRSRQRPRLRQAIIWRNNKAKLCQSLGSYIHMDKCV
jgi:hypothetical protein